MGAFKLAPSSSLSSSAPISGKSKVPITSTTNGVTDYSSASSGFSGSSAASKYPPTIQARDNSNTSVNNANNNSSSANLSQFASMRARREAKPSLNNVVDTDQFIVNCVDVMEKMTADDVARWLVSVGFASYTKTFKSLEVDGRALLGMYLHSDRLLEAFEKRLGMKMGEAFAFAWELDKLCNDPNSGTHTVLVASKTSSDPRCMSPESQAVMDRFKAKLMKKMAEDGGVRV
eukprot:c19532_g1_i1.p1 GENE.c19532_g1_i1~~c19532_g1_i1.p1  ORF type:complete len:246 (-),score=61.98 c19532_g1_i1:523-1218(-)